ncbi:hypothetical protein HO173_009207 [Letharia columbiana]|uniref:Uncharacterized protein n=1 Tax=Letharia columbiana TaxID=112416 RepID=A0A8H6L216_9LECA|nr:uncharacterized protein HO173_009207 [Letharia columbiana]KAF6232539.1 hypothetical protein HO173_009207 [Letharia columbiana]
MRYAIVGRQVAMASTICVATAPVPLFNYHKHTPYSYILHNGSRCYYQVQERGQTSHPRLQGHQKRPPRRPTRPLRPRRPPKPKHLPREEIVVHETSSSTISPDEIEETPPSTVKVDLQELIAQLSKVQEERNHRHRHEGRVYKSRRHHHRHQHRQSHRHRHSNTSDSNSSDSESDWEERRGVPFRHAEDKKPFLSIAETFRSVDVKYFKQIFFGTFKTKNFAKLAHMHTTPAKEDKDVNGHNHMEEEDPTQPPKHGRDRGVNQYGESLSPPPPPPRHNQNKIKASEETSQSWSNSRVNLP